MEPLAGGFAPTPMSLSVVTNSTLALFGKKDPAAINHIAESSALTETALSLQLGHLSVP